VDASGAVVPGSQITVIQKNTNSSYKSESSSSGNFTVPNLPGGAYQVKVEKQGFKAHVVDNVAVSPGGTASMDIKLEVGATSQSVEVSAAAQMVQTENARVSTTVSELLVASLPVLVNGASRSPFDIASTTPEVSTTGGYHIGGGNNAFGVSLDGSSMAGGKNGADQGDAATRFSPPVEALTEFNVEASGFKAESGHASGGTISFVSKSGTNQIHGSAFEFLRNMDLDARSFFQTTRNVYKQNNFGATLGGPLYVPKIYNGKNRTFFFLSYEGFRNRVGASSSNWLSVPTPEMYPTAAAGADFSKYVDSSNRQIPIYDPGSQTLVNGAYVRTPFPGNVIPYNRIDAVAWPIANSVKGMNLVPNRTDVSQAPGTNYYVRQNYISSGTQLRPSDKWSLKLDENAGSKHHFSYLMNRSKNVNDYGATGSDGLPFPIGGDVGVYLAQVYRGNWDYTVKPTFINRFYGGFNHYLEDQGGTSRQVDQSLATGKYLLPSGYWKQKNICVPGYPECSMFPPTSMSDYNGWGDTGTNGSDRIMFEMHDDMTWTKGSHTLQWGYFFNDTHYDGFGVQNVSGTTGYSWRSTAVPNAGGSETYTTGGNGFASFLLGQVNSDSLDTVRYVTMVYRTHQGYIQDDWKATKNLTLNLGLRFDYNLAMNAPDDRLSDLDLTRANPKAGGRPGAIVFAGFGTGRENSKSLIPDWKAIEPRVGLAYAINDKTTVRASASRYFGPVEGANGSSHYVGFVVKQTNADTTNGLFPLWTLAQGHPAYTPPPAIDPGVANGLSSIPYWNGINGNRPSAELAYSFNVQRQVTATSSLEVGYMSTLAGHLTSNILALNQVPYRSLPASLSPFTTAGRSAMGSLIDSTTAVSAGAVLPWTCATGSTTCKDFVSTWGTARSVTNAYRPYPMYGLIDGQTGGGDRDGHSTFHTMLVKYNKRMGSGLVVQASYKLSKWLDNAGTNGDQYNRKLLKSISGSDQTHVVQITYSYDLPFGKGKMLLKNGGPAAAILANWRVAGIQSYGSGTPMSLGGAQSFSMLGEYTNQIQITTYDNWRLPIKGQKFDPAVDLYLDASKFPTQTFTTFGNATRYNPKMRNMPVYNEDMNVARTFNLKEKARLEFKLEGFNVLNRVRFGASSNGTTVGNSQFGQWRSQANSQRRMQLVARLSW